MRNKPNIQTSSLHPFLLLMLKVTPEFSTFFPPETEGQGMGAVVSSLHVFSTSSGVGILTLFCSTV